MMNSSWADLVVLVSGAGSELEIGMALAHRLGAQGAELIVTASSARINERVAELRAAGFEAEGVNGAKLDLQSLGIFFRWGYLYIMSKRSPHELLRYFHHRV